MNNCLFCQIANKQTPAYILYENDVVIAFLSLENHPLIVPKKHFPDLSDLEDKYAEEIMKAAVVISKAMRAATGCEGMNLIQSNGVAAGQDVFHFHLHMKPRWQNDDVILKWDTNQVEEKQRVKLCADIKHALLNSKLA